MVTFVATVVLDLATAVILGIIAAGVLALRQVAGSATLTETPLEAWGESSDTHTAEERALLDEHIIAFRPEGALFFGAPTCPPRARRGERHPGRHPAVVPCHDAGRDGCRGSSDTIRSLENRGITVLLAGLPQQFTARLEATGILQRLRDQNHVFGHTPDAIEHARLHVARDGHHLT